MTLPMTTTAPPSPTAGAPAAATSADAQLVRGIGLWGAVALVIGNVIGSGIFLTTGIMVAELPSTTLVLTAWVAGGLLAMAGGLTYAEMGSMYPALGRPLRVPERGLRPGRGASCSAGRACW